MTILEFPRVEDKTPGGWRSSELQRLLAACNVHIPDGAASGWGVGETECGDPQLYVLGPAPEHDCILSISRLGRLYVLEDGNGRVIFENGNMMLLAEQAAAALRKKKQAILAQIAVAWCAAREFFEERVEPMMTEPVEVLSHFAPQFAALV